MIIVVYDFWLYLSFLAVKQTQKEICVRGEIKKDKKLNSYSLDPLEFYSSYYTKLHKKTLKHDHELSEQEIEAQNMELLLAQSIVKNAKIK